MNPVLDAATKRALLGAVLVTLATFFATLNYSDDWREIASITGAALCAQLIARLGIEGYVDVTRAKNGTVNPGDVPEASPKLVVTKVSN